MSTQHLKNCRGQGLVEYLVIVALMAVASIAVVRTLGQVVQTRFSAVAAGLQGETRAKKVRIEDSIRKRKDMGNFFEGAGSKSASSSTNSAAGGDQGDSDGASTGESASP